MSNRGTESHLPHQTVGGGVAGKLDIQARGDALRAFCFIRCYWIFCPPVERAIAALFDHFTSS